MSPKNLLTQGQLKEYLTYNPETGQFNWRVAKGSRVVPGQVAGSVSKVHGYVFIVLNQYLYRAHRLAWLYMTGGFPAEGLDIDHINRDRSDNRWINLRLATRSENNRNNAAKGYHPSANGKKWVARFKKPGKKSNYLGTYDTEEEAHDAFIRAKRESA